MKQKNRKDTEKELRVIENNILVTKCMRSDMITQRRYDKADKLSAIIKKEQYLLEVLKAEVENGIQSRG